MGLKPGADTVLDAETLESLAGDIPTAELALSDLVGKTVVDVMAATGGVRCLSELIKTMDHEMVYM